jgi:hypothetical protein
MMITTSATPQNWKKKKKHLHASSSYLLFQNPPIKLKCGLHRRGRLLIATHLDQSNYLANQKRKYSQLKHDLTLFIKLFQASESWAWVFHRIGLIAVPDPRFLVQGHIPCAGGDTLSGRNQSRTRSGYHCGCWFTLAEKVGGYEYFKGLNLNIVVLGPVPH